MEFIDLSVQYEDCNDAGGTITRTTTVKVPKGTNGDARDLYTLILNRIGVATNSLCIIDNKIEQIDPCVGVPLRGWEQDTGEVAVLYFNDQLTAKLGIGRYVNIPYPNRSAILQWAASIPTWQTGNVYVYTQYTSSQGVKIANYAPRVELALQQQAVLKSLTRLPQSDVYFDAPPRLVKDKQVLTLSLKRVTYFPSGKEQAGRQAGAIWYTRPLA
jgi:hypothetical protein